MIRKRKLRRISSRKCNNMGMSLVEVIIAMAMLSIVALVVLQCMTVAMQYNLKARERQNTNTAAENVMETFKGYKLEELRELFITAQTGTEAEKQQAFLALGISAADCFTYPTAPASNPGASVEKIMQAPELTYRIDGMTDLNGNLIGNMEIKATQTSVSEIMEIENIVPTRDAIFRDTYITFGEVKALAMEDFKDKYLDAFLVRLNELDERPVELTEDDFDGNSVQFRQRDVNVNIDKEGSEEVVKVDMEYFYYLKYPYRVWKEEFIDEATGEGRIPGYSSFQEFLDAGGELGDYFNTEYFIYPENIDPGGNYSNDNKNDYYRIQKDFGGGNNSVEIYRNSKQGEEAPLQRFYLFYYPTYDMKERISIKTNYDLGREILGFIIKQVPPNYSGGNAEALALANKDRYYHPFVDGNNAKSEKIILYHNLGKTLGTDSFIWEYPTEGRFEFFDSARNYIGNVFLQYKETLYDLEMKITKDGKTVAHYEGTTNQYIGSNRGSGRNGRYGQLP